MSKPHDVDDIRHGLEDMLRSLIGRWRENPSRFDDKTILSAIQYGGMYLNRQYGWAKYDEPSGAGTAITRYTGAFKTPGHGGTERRARPARSAPALAYDNPDTDDDGDDAAD